MTMVIIYTNERKTLYKLTFSYLVINNFQLNYTETVY